MESQQLAPAKPREPSSFIEQFLEPLSRLRNEVDRVFDEFPARLPALSIPSRLAAIMPTPALEMTETDKAYKISVEVPGIPADRLDLEIEQGLLVIKGEKKEEREEKERDYTRSERAYGAFERRIALPADAKVDHVKAKAHDGVLKISIPRDGNSAKARRKIEINGAKKD
jgi:HSP20 family protein